jgi:hypothetical protein
MLTKSVKVHLSSEMKKNGTYVFIKTCFLRLKIDLSLVVEYNKNDN